MCDLGRGTYYIIKKSREKRIRHFLRAKANVEEVTSEMSEYFQSLDYLVQRRYTEKLTICDFISLLLITRQSASADLPRMQNHTVQYK